MSANRSTFRKNVYENFISFIVTIIFFLSFLPVLIHGIKRSMSFRRKRAALCCYFVSDSYGDGWDGASLDVCREVLRQMKLLPLVILKLSRLIYRQVRIIQYTTILGPLNTSILTQLLLDGTQVYSSVRLQRRNILHGSCN